MLEEKQSSLVLVRRPLEVVATRREDSQLLQVYSLSPVQRSLMKAAVITTVLPSWPSPCSSNG